MLNMTLTKSKHLRKLIATPGMVATEINRTYVNTMKGNKSTPYSPINVPLAIIYNMQLEVGVVLQNRKTETLIIYQVIKIGSNE